MKKIKYKLLALAGLAMIVVVTACEKFLDRPPLGTLSPNVMATEKGSRVC